MTIFAAAFICGLGAAEFFPFFPASLSSISVLAVVYLFLSAGRKAVSLPAYRKAGRNLLLIAVCLCGFLYGLLRKDTLPEITFPEKDIVVEGTLVEVPEMSGEKFRFTLNEVIAGGENIQGRVRLVMLPALYGDHFQEDLFIPGSRISAIAKLRGQHVFSNPGVYAYNVKGSGVAATGYVRQLKIVRRDGDLLAWISRQRQELGRIIDNSLSPENASFLKAIIPGLRRGISPEMRDAFSATGLAHLLSISGTHFGLLAFIFFNMTRLIVKSLPAAYLARLTLYITPAQTAIIITLPVLITYAAISGLSTPTIRSFIVILVCMLALFLGRKDQWLNSLSVAAVLILLWKPAALFELSFLLSFSAVLSIGYVLEKRSSAADNPIFPKDKAIWIAKIAEKIKTVLLITVAAVAGTAPIVLLVFKQFPLISPVTNLMVTPVVCFVVLPLGFVSGFSALMLNMPSMPLSGIIDGVTYLVLNMIRAASGLPFASLHTHNPSLLIVVFYFLSLIFLAKSGVKWRVIPLLMVIIFYLFAPYLDDNNLKVTFLDVGQGDAAVVELPDGKVMLIDGGSHDPDMGRRVIAPHLWSKGIRTIDYMVMSHAHPDHYGGLLYITDHFKIREVWSNGGVTAGSEKVLERLSRRLTPRRSLARGDLLEGPAYRITVLHPYNEFYAGSPRGEFSDRNSESLVIKIESDNVSILFTGDIEEEAEADLLNLGENLKSDILKMPHHGGRTSSSEAFIQATAPRLAVASVGKQNHFHHPHRDTLERYRKYGVKVLRTDMDGAVTITADNGGYQIETDRDRRFIKALHLRDEMRNLRLLFQ